jgi:hypothetical protein
MSYSLPGYVTDDFYALEQDSASAYSACEIILLLWLETQDFVVLDLRPPDDCNLSTVQKGVYQIHMHELYSNHLLK